MIATPGGLSATPTLPPPAVRRTAAVALGIAFVHIVFGAIVRISGSGMGCGDNWPKCYGYWVPPFDRPDLIIEVTHRYLAAALFVAIAAVRRTAGGGGAAVAARPAGVSIIAPPPSFRRRSRRGPRRRSAAGGPLAR
jgi:heme A synthase